jgi:hypothetical protein
MSRRVLRIAVSCFLLGFAAVHCAAAAPDQHPAVLFGTGWVHNTYVVRPLLAMGVEVDVCAPEKMAERLRDGKHNVVVVSTINADQRKAIDDFLARGGGALVCNPENSWSSKDWTGANEWLTRLGARPRWEVLQDGDKANVAADVMGCRLSFSDQVTAPVNQAVRGVLTLTWAGTTGC